MNKLESFKEKEAVFTDAEREYLSSQLLARVATVSARGEVDVAPVGLHLDGDRFVIVGYDLPSTFKYKNVKANGSAAIVVDDLPSVDPWRTRGVKIHGRGEVVKRGDGREVIVVTPQRKWSWGLG